MNAKRYLVALAVILAGCGKSAESDLVELRMLGVNAQGMSQFELPPPKVQIQVNGTPVPSRQALSTLDLAIPGQAWLIGQFDPPPRDAMTHVTVTFAPEMFVFLSTLSDLAKTAGPPLEFDAPGEWFVPRRHVVLHVDLAKSLLPSAEAGHVFIPSLTIHN